MFSTSNRLAWHIISILFMVMLSFVIIWLSKWNVLFKHMPGRSFLLFLGALKVCWCAFVREFWNIDSEPKHSTLLWFSTSVDIARPFSTRDTRDSHLVSVWTAKKKKNYCGAKYTQAYNIFIKTAPHCPTKLYPRTQNRYISDTVADHLMNFCGNVVFFGIVRFYCFSM